jgi:hypothetical protein
MNFTAERKWDIVTGSVVFGSNDGDQRLAHQVSEEALADHFGFDGPAELSAAAFDANRQELERLAETAIAEGQVNASGGASITSEWLTKKSYRGGRGSAI